MRPILLISLLLVMRYPCLAQGEQRHAPDAAAGPILSSGKIPPQPKLSVSFAPLFGFDSQHALIFPSDEDSAGIASKRKSSILALIQSRTAARQEIPSNGTAGSIVAETSFQSYPINLRYQADSATAYEVYIPYITRAARLELDGKRLLSLRGQGLGDIQVGFERQLRLMRSDATASVIRADLILPTSKNPFNTEPPELPVGNGLYALNCTLGIRNVSDPIALSASASLNYSFARATSEVRARPGLGYSLSTEVGYALSDHIILSEQLLFSQRPNVLLLLGSNTNMKVNETYITHSVLFNPGNLANTYRAGFTVGLNEASTDYIFSFTLQK